MPALYRTGGLCPGGVSLQMGCLCPDEVSLSRGSLYREGSLPREGYLSREGCLSGGGLSKGVSVQRVSVWGSLSRGSLSGRPPPPHVNRMTDRQV